MVSLAEEVTVDTDILVHAANPGVDQFPHSVAFLRELESALGCALAVDPGFSLDSARNTSLICHEYLERVPPQSLGYAVLTALFANRRIVEVSRNLPASVKKIVEQHIRNKRDRTFLAVAHNNSAKLLVSHDRRDYSESKRRFFSRKLGVTICDAADCPRLGRGRP